MTHPPIPDERGKFGPYGGQFVPETLMPALDELIHVYDEVRQDEVFLAEFNQLLKSYVGRPSPITHAKRRLTEQPGWGANLSQARRP
jgi:tryptophan synthase beta chain